MGFPGLDFSNLCYIKNLEEVVKTGFLRIWKGVSNPVF